MPLKLTCPRCKKALTLPRNVAGSYTKCAHCSGRIWVPEIPGSERGSPAAAGPPPAPPTSATPVPPAAPGNVGSPAPSGSAPRSIVPAASATAVPPLSAAPPPPAPWTSAGQAQGQAQAPGAPAAGRKARLITSGTTESGVQPGADGKLPELRLEQDAPEQKRKEKSEGAGLHPLVLFCALCLSVLVSITMVLVDIDGPQTDLTRQQALARWTIEREYFSHLDPNKPLAAYQLKLRGAHRAHARGDRQAERDAYRDVLRMLRAERGRFDGLTGSPKSDRDLEALITVILRE